MLLENGLPARITRNKIQSTLASVIVRMAAIAAVAGPFIFFAATLVLESVQPGYNRTQETISALVWGQHGWGQTIVFYLFACGLVGLAWCLSRYKTGRKEFQLGIAFLVLMSLGFIIIAVFPTRAPGADVTLTSTIHQQTARIICSLFPIVSLLIARGLRGQPNSSRIWVFTLVSSGIGLGLVLAGVLVTVTGASWMGALERVMLANGLIWIEVIGMQNYFLTPASTRRTPESGSTPVRQQYGRAFDTA